VVKDPSGANEMTLGELNGKYFLPNLQQMLFEGRISIPKKE
jgi:hypothetical protein